MSSTGSAPPSRPLRRPRPALRQLNPAVVYTLGRFAVFVVLAAVLYLIGFRSWFLVLLALLLSMPLSYFLLRRPRLAFAQRIERRGEQRRVLRAKLRGDLPPE